MTTHKSVLTSHQVSMTEWFAAIGEIEESQAFRDEDNRKTERLSVLAKEMKLPFREPVIFSAEDVKALTPAFAKVLQTRASESVAFRLTSLDPNLPKLRSRGLSLKDCYEQWFLKLTIDFSAYQVAIFPNETEITWSMTFVVNEDGAFGEIIRGKHSQLSQGETEQELYAFFYNFQNWYWSTFDQAAEEAMQSVLASLRVEGKLTQEELHKQLQAKFSHNYLLGYFEATQPEGEERVYFIDYNRILPKYLATPSPESFTKYKGLHGIPAQGGQAKGRVFLVTEETVESVGKFPEGAILVCNNTDVRYLPFMKKAAAILTERGGTLAHAAIIARELKKPCIVNIKDVTKKLVTGQEVLVDAQKGIVY